MVHIANSGLKPVECSGWNLLIMFLKKKNDAVSSESCFVRLNWAAIMNDSAVELTVGCCILQSLSKKLFYNQVGVNQVFFVLGGDLSCPERSLFSLLTLHCKN